jgi:hypothetical protein
MHSFAYQFKEIQRLNPYWSSWVCFCETLKRMKIKDRGKIRKYFNQLVEKDDYAKSEKNQLINYLVSPEFWK